MLIARTLDMRTEEEVKKMCPPRAGCIDPIYYSLVLCVSHKCEIDFLYGDLFDKNNNICSSSNTIFFAFSSSLSLRYSFGRIPVSGARTRNRAKTEFVCVCLTTHSCRIAEFWDLFNPGSTAWFSIARIERNTARLCERLLFDYLSTLYCS